jgi:hypothetical protein
MNLRGQQEIEREVRTAFTPIRSHLRILYKTRIEELTNIKKEIFLKKESNRLPFQNNLPLILKGLQKRRARIDRYNIGANQEADFGIALL